MEKCAVLKFQIVYRQKLMECGDSLKHAVKTLSHGYLLYYVLGGCVRRQINVLA